MQAEQTKIALVGEFNLNRLREATKDRNIVVITGGGRTTSLADHHIMMQSVDDDLHKDRSYWTGRGGKRRIYKCK